MTSQPLDSIISEHARVLYGPAGYPLQLSVDPFGRLRVGELHTVFDSKQVGAPPPGMVFAEALTGGATSTHSALRSSTTLSVQTAGDAAIRQTRRHFAYQPGKGWLIKITTIARSTGATVRVGYDDGSDGVSFVIAPDGSPSFVLRSSVSGSVVETTVPRSAWTDPLDGTGVSGQTLDASKGQILFISMAWLGLGDVVVGFQFGNSLVTAYTFANSGTLDAVYMRTPDLPIRWELSTAATLGAPAELETVCCTVGSESGWEPLGMSLGDAALGVTCASGAWTEVISGRLRSDGSGVAETHATVYPTQFTIRAESNVEGEFAVVYRTYGYSYSGGSATWRAPSGENATSHAEVTDGGRIQAAIADVGHILFMGPIAGKSTVSADLGKLLALGAAATGHADEIAVLVKPSTNASISAFVHWTELV